jgi:hypothetical protein
MRYGAHSLSEAIKIPCVLTCSTSDMKKYSNFYCVPFVLNRTVIKDFCCAWMAESTVPRSLDRKQTLTEMVTKAPDLWFFGLLFVGPYEDFSTLGDNTWPGPPATPNHCSLHGNHMWYVEERAAEVGDLITEVSTKMVIMSNKPYTMAYIPHGSK